MRIVLGLCCPNAMSEDCDREVKKLKEEPLKYLESTPPSFKDIADALLILDSGEELPAHRCLSISQTLTYQ